MRFERRNTKYMRILWLTNIMLPKVANHISKSANNGGGWLTGLSNDLLNHKGIELAVCFPVSGTKSMINGTVDNLKYYGFPQIKSESRKNINSTESYLRYILNDFQPDVVHIFGTEYIHSLLMTKVFDKPSKTIINIQGLVSIYYQHFYAGLPNSIINRFSFRDFIKQNNIKQQANIFLKRGGYEIEALQNCNHIVGRTDWDKACSNKYNPDAKYYFCNESLRDVFYNNTWDINTCERNSIFISQATYPIKGVHFMIEAMPQILKYYPKTHLYIAGHNIIENGTLKDKLKITSYGKYISRLIKKYNLINYITFTGNLDEQQMCNQMLNTHLFVSPSSIENSPNSVGEAMILGVPVVSSDVGGVKNMLCHEQDGYIYQYDAPYMLSYYVCKIFENDKIALDFSYNSKKHASQTHNRIINLKTMIGIYQEIEAEK